MKKKDWLFITLLSTILILIVIGLYSQGYLFGATIDWGSQHTMFPEYLRSEFYKTGNIFPDFALSLGAGQNIYNISYYGLLNPVIMLSYLFPFIKMVDYMIIISILSIIISTTLCYYWLKKHQFSDTTVRVGTLLFICAAPLIFQSHRHIMFVNYMPFLLLTLLGIDHYFEKKKIGWYTLGTIGMILTSYYYSIGGLLVAVIYGVYIYLKQTKKITLKKFLIDGSKFSVPIFLSIGIGAILLLPTMYVIFQGRTGNKELFSLGELLFPHLDVGALVYSAYSVGLTAIIFLSLIHAFFTKKKETKFLSLTILLTILIPIIMYALNGFLYIRAKVLIPFLPLCIYVIAHYLDDIWNHNISFRKEGIVIMMMIVCFLLMGYHNNIFYLDCFLTAIALFFYHEKQKPFLFIIPLILVSLVTVISVNSSEEYQKRAEYQEAFAKEKVQLIEEITSKDKNFYRFNDLTSTLLTVNKVYTSNYYQTSLYSSTLHLDYQNLFYNTFGNADTYRNRLVTSQSNNTLFQTYMNVKYVVAEIDNQPLGYELVKQNGKFGLYQNNTTYPLGFASSQLVSTETYQNQTFPHNIETLLQAIVVDGKQTTQISPMIEPIKLIYQAPSHSLTIKNYKNGYQIKASEKTNLKVKLLEEIPAGKVVLLKFRIEKSANCKDGDLSIKINNISNKLTCKQWMYHNNNYEFEYIISANQPIKELEVEFSPGTFFIVDQESYIVDYQLIKESASDLDPFVVNTSKTKGSRIEGTINVTEDGYFALTIPYDKHFNIKVDGKEQTYEQVNQAFIGFPITKGTHNIELVYHAPLKRIGGTISIISTILFIIILYRQRKLT